MLTATPEQDKEAASRQEAQAELVSPSASDTATAVMPECWERAEPAAVAAIAVPGARAAPAAPVIMAAVQAGHNGTKTALLLPAAVAVHPIPNRNCVRKSSTRRVSAAAPVILYFLKIRRRHDKIY